jgi:hypothetical protein
MQWFMSVILATQEVEIRRIMVQGQPRQKVGESPSPPKAGHGDLCLSSQLFKRSKQEDYGPGWTGQKLWRPYPKNNQSKKGMGGVAQVVAGIRPQIQTPVPQKKKKI